jgi:hypothetical protein
MKPNTLLAGLVARMALGLTAAALSIAAAEAAGVNSTPHARACMLANNIDPVGWTHHRGGTNADVARYIACRDGVSADRAAAIGKRDGNFGTGR